MADPTEINSVFWNEEKKSWDHKMIQVEEYHGFVECQQCRRPLSHNIKTDGEFKVVYVSIWALQLTPRDVSDSIK